jgi:hypothetical protein
MPPREHPMPGSEFCALSVTVNPNDTAVDHGVFKIGIISQVQTCDKMYLPLPIAGTA